MFFTIRGCDPFFGHRIQPHDSRSKAYESPTINWYLWITVQHLLFCPFVVLRATVRETGWKTICHLFSEPFTGVQTGKSLLYKQGFLNQWTSIFLQVLHNFVKIEFYSFLSINTCSSKAPIRIYRLLWEFSIPAGILIQNWNLYNVKKLNGLSCE